MKERFYQASRRRFPGFTWLLNPSEGRLKVQVAIASALVLIAAGLMIRDRVVLAARDTAYAKILTAQAQQHDFGIIEASETFFANAPLSGKDGRNQLVMDLYTESLVRWLAQKNQAADTAVQARVQRYRAVMNTINENAINENPVGENAINENPVNDNTATEEN